MAITQPTADIAYAIASGNGTSVRLDNLEFDVQPVITTDANGEYRLTDVDAGTFMVASNAPAGWTPTSSLTGTHTVVMAAGEMVANRDFGRQTAPLYPGISVSTISGDTTEAGGTATFSVVHDSPPADDVTISLSSSDISEGTLSTSILTFTPLNWGTAQSVTVNSVNDDVDDGDRTVSIITANAVSTDANYNGLNPTDVSVTNIDDDTAGISVCPWSAQVTTEAAGTDSFEIVLDSQPTANVTVGVSSDNSAEGVASTASVTFTPANWSQPQSVTVTGTRESESLLRSDTLRHSWLLLRLTDRSVRFYFAIG